MKKFTVGLALLAVVLSFNSCYNDDTSPIKGYVAFSLSQDKINEGRLATSTAAFAIVDIKDNQGKIIFEKQRLSLSLSGQDYVSESLSLNTGNFKLTSFVILNSADEIIYATPVESASKAKSLQDPLPIDFSVLKGNTAQVTPEIVAVTSVDSPESFGYASFGFNQVSREFVNLKVVVKLLVGEFLYENIEAPIQIKGFDSDNNITWSDTISFTGPKENLVPVLSGFHHYTIALNKWGVTDSQTITGQQLHSDRADGAAPVTYGLGGKVPYIKKPVITFEYTQDPGGSLKTKSKTEYQYNTTGKIAQIILYENYSTETPGQGPTRYTIFNYDPGTGALSKLSEYYVADNFKSREDTYEYGVGESLIRITESNYAANLTATMTLSFDASYVNAKAAYLYSNGIGFDYNFSYSLKNIVSDATVKESSLCNQGAYTYDRNINPFKHLGYVGFLMDNYSVNNKLTEKVDYLSCGFPVLIPESYEYQYDDLGYPTSKITHYKGTAVTTATKYYYQVFPQ